MTANQPDACAQPECTGHLQDGYCDICGSPPSSAQSSAATPSSSAQSSGKSSLGSEAIALAELGSRRIRAGSGQSRRLKTDSARLRLHHLGAGLTSVPPQPPVPASTAILANPQVAETKRVCPQCESPVGRSIDGRPGRTEGFCPQCGSAFSFTPKLKAGDLVGSQYEVAGCLAHGGLGWIYLARDKNVSDRWVVLKGLLNSGDADAQAAAIAEQKFLAEVEHPAILDIYNFVTHEGAGYIVMEYIGGTSLKTLLRDRKEQAGQSNPLPLAQAISYILAVLPAFQYLHDLGLIYCDFKPDNILQIGDSIKLIDLGAVCRLTDTNATLYGTVGYQAPEIAELGPSVASDIYTIGRTLMVLATDFRGFQSQYLYTLPTVDETPLFQQHDSFRRLMLKACAPDPNDRFVSAAELRVQLLGVLREVVAVELPDGAPAPKSEASVLFSTPNFSVTALDWQHLPTLIADPTDPESGWLESIDVQTPGPRLAILQSAPHTSVEVQLDVGYTALRAGELAVVAATTEALLQADPWEWRAMWLNGLAAMHAKDWARASGLFNAVYGQVPGELAPKLALAMACEQIGQLDHAQALYEICARSELNYRAPAAFGLARIRSSRGDVTGAVAALDLVPITSRASIPARLQRAEQLAQAKTDLPTLSQALASIDGIEISAADRARITAQVFTAALEQVQTSGPDHHVKIGAKIAHEPQLRDGLEAAHRELARQSPAHSSQRIKHVDTANSVRRWSWR